MTAAEAAVSCSVEHGGRLAVFVKREELNEIKLRITSPNAWIGLFNINIIMFSHSVCYHKFKQISGMGKLSNSDNLVLADGREFTKGDILQL